MILPRSFQGQVSGEAFICHPHDTGAFFFVLFFSLHCKATQMCECRDTDTAKLFHLSLQWRSLLSAVLRQSLWNVSSPLRFLLTITINILPPATLRLRFRGMTSSYPTSCLASHDGVNTIRHGHNEQQNSQIHLPSMLVIFIMQH